jgi:ribose transport system substrate-binding protein
MLSRRAIDDEFHDPCALRPAAMPAPPARPNYERSKPAPQIYTKLREKNMSKVRLIVKMWAASAAILGQSIVAAHADDDYVKMAKEFISRATAPTTGWAGPTAGPKAQRHKVVIYVSADQRNGGARGVDEGAEEAAKVIGWDFRTLDGQGSVSERTSVLNQAIALKPNGIILGSVDAAEQAPLIEQAAKQGISVVGWHSGPGPGTIEGSPIFTNVTTDPTEVGKTAGLYAVADSNGTAGVVLFTDSIYQVATNKTDAAASAVRGCKTCKVLSIEDTPINDASNRMPQLTTSLLSRFGKKWTYSIGVNDLYFDFMAPSLRSADIPGNGFPRSISAGDGSVPAFERIRETEYQVGTVAEPLHLHGWQCIDELNRAFAGQPPSGFVAAVHLFVPSNISSDGGANEMYDPAGYKEAYTKIWGK